MVKVPDPTEVAKAFATSFEPVPNEKRNEPKHPITKIQKKGWEALSAA